MPYSVVFSPEASDQLEALLLYIAADSSLPVASRYTEAVVVTCETCACFRCAVLRGTTFGPGCESRTTEVGQ